MGLFKLVRGLKIVKIFHIDRATGKEVFEGTETRKEEEIDLHVIKDISFSGEQSVIVYESPGSDGGTVITTGRKNQTVTLNGMLIETDLATLTKKKDAIEKMRDKGEPVNLLGPLSSANSGKYIIGTFEGSLPEGQERYITFTLTLIEFRQANISAASISLVNFQPTQLLLQRARDRQFVAQGS